MTSINIESEWTAENEEVKNAHTRIYMIISLYDHYIPQYKNIRSAFSLSLPLFYSTLFRLCVSFQFPPRHSSFNSGLLFRSSADCNSKHSSMSALPVLDSSVSASITHWRSRKIYTNISSKNDEKRCL